MSQNDLLNKFFSGVNKIAAVSLAISYPTQASLSHLLNGAFKKLVSISLATEIEFKESKSFKEYAANPSKFASSAPAGGGGGGAGAAPAAAKVEEKPKEKSEESEADMGFSLFD